MESEHEEDDPVVEPEEVPMTAPPVKTPAPVVEPPEETPVGKATVEPVNKIPAVAPKPMQDYLEPYCNTTICVNIASYIISFRTRSLWGYHFVGGINASFDIKQPCQHQRVEARSGFQSDQCFLVQPYSTPICFTYLTSTAQPRTEPEEVSASSLGATSARCLASTSHWMSWCAVGFFALNLMYGLLFAYPQENLLAIMLSSTRTRDTIVRLATLPGLTSSANLVRGNRIVARVLGRKNPKRKLKRKPQPWTNLSCC